MTLEAVQPAPLPPPSRLQELFSWGGLAIACMLALLVAAAFWSVNRRRARQAREQDPARRPADPRDAWAEAGQRARTPSSDDLTDQHQ